VHQVARRFVIAAVTKTDRHHFFGIFVVKQPLSLLIVFDAALYQHFFRQRVCFCFLTHFKDDEFAKNVAQEF